MPEEALVLARELMSQVTAKTRSNSRLPELVDLMLAQLGGALPRELTG